MSHPDPRHDSENELLEDMIEEGDRNYDRQKEDEMTGHIERNKNLIQELGQYAGVYQAKLDDMKSKVGGDDWVAQGKEFERLKIKSLINSPIEYRYERKTL